jgi:hypothetical protein
MNKSDWITKGAIVLIAERGLSTSTTGNNGKEIGDVTHVFDTFFYKDLKAMPNTNPVLFTQVEEKNIDEVMKRVKAEVDVDDDDFFLQEGEEEGTAAAEKNAKEASEKEEKEAAWKESEKARAVTMRSRREEKEVTFDEL